MFKKKCLDRHFWLSVKSNYSNSEVRFDFEGNVANCHSSYSCVICYCVI